eukprot:TRINITY_DN2665_c0_g1_i1.p3 TRINITY_DN2665_c0_g1~~TRINITY_DN2665_c0_g1_i1.p3  ORF type:complete len:188 (+),score=78.83 TRINITY_DN2665_c0_g1_i1:125-688(+)
MGLGTSAPSHFDLMKEGEALADAGDYTAAAERYTEALQVAPDYWVAFLRRGVCLHAAGLHALALADLTTCLELEDTVTARRARVRVYEALGRCSDAAAERQRAGAMDDRAAERRAARAAVKAEEKAYWDGVDAAAKKKATADLSNTDFGKWMKGHQKTHRRKEELKRNAEPPAHPGFDGGDVYHTAE